MKARLKIALLCFPSAGGSGIVAAELARGLARRGHQVHVIASAAPLRGIPQQDNLHFHAINVPEYPLFEHPPYAVAAAATIVRVVQEYGVQVVHSHYALPHAASAQLAAQALGAAAPCFVTTLHGTDVTLVGADPAFASITRATTRASDGLSVPSEFLCEQARHWLGDGPAPPIEVIANFVDEQRFAPPAARDRARLYELFGGAGSGDRTEPVLVHVSNFRPIKRVGDALEVLARVRSQRAARLCLIGDGPERAQVERVARELGLRDAVRFLGRRVDVADYLRHADAFLLTSESESFGLAALEALSCGVPVFGYRVGGLPEVVTPEVGRLVAPFDQAALAQAVASVLTDGALHDALRAGARDHVLLRFRSDPALDRYEEWYRRALAAAAQRRRR